MPKTVYDIIKKQNGEAFAQKIRKYDNGIFDIENLPEIVEFCGRDAEPILEYLEGLKLKQIGLTKEKEAGGQPLDPIKLLDEAGYDAYVADTLQKQNQIRKYFQEGEELCTFKDAKRYENFHIINAVKKNVDQIRREDFITPHREDEYGRSVISIQILKTGGQISIKNRYNHNVVDPDNTFNSNPDNIIPGLTNALKKYFNVEFKSNEVLPFRYRLFDNRLVRYYFESNNIYFGENVWFQYNQPHKPNKDYQVMFDKYLLDLKAKKVSDISTYVDFLDEPEDEICRVLNAEIKDKKLKVIVNEKGNQCVTADGVQIMEIESGRLVSLNLPTTQNIGMGFGSYCSDIRKCQAPELKSVGKEFLNSSNLEEIDVPKLESVESYFLTGSKQLKKATFPKLKLVNGNHFMDCCHNLEEVKIPNLIDINGIEFCAGSHNLKSLYAPRFDWKSYQHASGLFYNNPNKAKLIEMNSSSMARSNYSWRYAR